jgi:two-component system, chemotaxis family, chemotaxis protein CheY
MASSQTPIRILIVDDDPDWRGVLRLTLEDMGYCAVEASNGQQALDLLEQEAFPIVLLDMAMPGMDGAEVIARMPRPLPRVVLLTAADADAVGDTLASGPLYYLPKDSGTDGLSLLLPSLEA